MEPFIKTASISTWMLPGAPKPIMQVFVWPRHRQCKIMIQTFLKWLTCILVPWPEQHSIQKNILYIHSRKINYKPTFNAVVTLHMDIV